MDFSRDTSRQREGTKHSGEKKREKMHVRQREKEGTQVQILYTKRPNREASVEHMEASVREQKYLEG